MRKSLLFVMFVLVGLFLAAQDVHFSQYNNVPFYLNPAKSGLMSEQFRVSANTKIQWRSVTAPYQTYLAAGDMSIQRKGSHLGKVGLGIDFMREKSGDAGFGTSGFGLSFSYIKALNRFNNRFLSGGASIRMHQRSFDPSALTFDSQFNGLNFDPQLEGGETFSDLNFWYPVVGAGLSYLMRLDSQHEIIAGLSALNLNHPRQSHFDDNSIRLRTRWVADLSYKSSVTRNSAVYPSLFFSKQGVYNEFILGADYRFVKNFNPWNYTAYSGGLFYRAGDGFILSTRFDYMNYRFGISYDVNTSKLTPASQLRGGFEFSFVAVFNRTEHKNNREIPCPIF